MAKQKVFVTRIIAQQALDKISEETEMELWQEELPPPYEVLLQKARDTEGMLTLLTDTIDAALMDAAPKLKVVSNLAVGYDNIDVPAASQRDIYVANVPGFCIDEVADHTMALMLGLKRKIIVLNQRVRKGAWGWDEFKPIFGLKGQTYGVVGFGSIGRAVARRAQVFGFNIVATDPVVSPEEAKKYGVKLVDFSTLLEISDVISIHVPMSISTHHLFNEETLGKMKKTAYLVNTSRGGILDQESLYKALASKKLAGAALDVMEKEPPEITEALFTLDNVILTPHIAEYSEDSMNELRQRICRDVARVLKGEKPDGCVNCKEVSK